jgi:hypothetical protein
MLNLSAWDFKYFKKASILSLGTFPTSSTGAIGVDTLESA